jgi:hypothetical protein
MHGIVIYNVGKIDSESNQQGISKEKMAVIT